MAGSAPVSIVRAVLWGGLALFTAGCATRPVPPDGTPSVQGAAVLKDPGLPGYPEDNWGATRHYASQRAWSDNPNHYEDKQIGCKNSAGNTIPVMMRIQPEQSVRELSSADFRSRGRFVALIRNRDTVACAEWDLPPGGIAYLWMGPIGGGRAEVRVYREQNAQQKFVVKDSGEFEDCSHAPHPMPKAAWTADCPPHLGLTHGSTWVSCAGGCCYAKSLNVRT